MTGAAAAAGGAPYLFEHDDLNAWARAVGADPRFRQSTRLTTYAVRQYINRRTGRLWPSASTVGRETCQSPGRVRHALADLVDAGYLAVVELRPGRPTVYAVNMPSTGRAASGAPQPDRGAPPVARGRAASGAGGAPPAAREPVGEPVENPPDLSPIPAWVAHVIARATGTDP